MSSCDAEPPLRQPCLKNMDTLLRCPICFDYLNISMMSQCSHNFCSLCIRKFLSYKLQCPVCNEAMTEQDLRNNRILDELVKTFQHAR
ncbi:E3 ubiquitin-protein ligase RAD18-like [Denticeps clupeoides]|nr:E3 ubiquitin-protein ligase RAD18-like [Denticeps clupeoides]XP_028853541.1 E3 ubiquitin-protein ligase RAD18-like [Denticeps clupeoides]